MTPSLESHCTALGDRKILLSLTIASHPAAAHTLRPRTSPPPADTMAALANMDLTELRAQLEVAPEPSNL